MGNVGTLGIPLTDKFTNQKRGKIKSLMIGIGDPQNGSTLSHPQNKEFNSLQLNFLKALKKNNPDVKLYVAISQGDPRLTTAENELEKIGYTKKQVQFLQQNTEKDALTDWVQDNMISVRERSGRILLLKPNGGYGVGDNLANILASKDSHYEVKESTVYFEGGDVVSGEKNGQPVLFVGMKSLQGHASRKYNQDKKFNSEMEERKALLKSINDMQTEFSQYGFSPENIIPLGTNLKHITYEDVFKTLSPSELSKINPYILKNKNELFPMDNANYHSDLVIFPTGKKIQILKNQLYLCQNHFLFLKIILRIGSGFIAPKI